MERRKLPKLPPSHRRKLDRIRRHPTMHRPTTPPHNAALADRRLEEAGSDEISTLETATCATMRRPESATASTTAMPHATDDATSRATAPTGTATITGSTATPASRVGPAPSTHSARR